jgi:hypothetical protein
MVYFMLMFSYSLTEVYTYKRVYNRKGIVIPWVSSSYKHKILKLQIKPTVLRTASAAPSSD